MKSKNELKEIDIKNRAFYYFDDKITDRDIYSVDILLDEKMYENISVYDISYKDSTGKKPLRIRFDKIDGSIRARASEFKHLALFDNRLFDKICDKIKHFISDKSGIADSINHGFGEIRIDSYNYLPIEKIYTFHNVIISLSQLLIRRKITTAILYF